MLQTTNYSLNKPESTDVIDIADLNGNFDTLDSELKKISDKANIIQTAGGTGTAITLNNASLVNGFTITFIVAANNNGAATTINGKALYKPGGTTAPKLIAGKAVTVWYNGTNFFIKASAEGDAIAGNVLAGKTFSNDDDTGLAGTMPNNGPSVAETINLTTGGAEYTIPAGHHSGLRKIKAVITNLIASVIKAGTTVGGVLGTFTSDATATDADVLANKTYYRNGVKGTGSIPIGGNEEYVGWVRGEVGVASFEGRAHFYIPTNKYYNGTANSGAQGVFADDPDYIAANIIASANIFGLQGGIPVKDTSANWVAEDVYPTSAGLLVKMPVGYYSPGGTSANQATIGGWLHAVDPDFIPSNILNTANIFGMQGTAIAGRRSASGTITTSDDPATFQGHNEQYSMYKAIASGLSFKPSDIMFSWISTYGGQPIYYLTHYTSFGGLFTKEALVIYFNAQSRERAMWVVKCDAASAYVVDGGFCLPTTLYKTTLTYLAIE